MHCGPDRGVYSANYPSKGGRIARITGVILIAAGILLIVLCVPLWAWLALIGAVLIFIGVLLLHK